MEAPRLSYFAMILILLLAIISFIFVVFGLKGFSFVFELALLLAFMFLLAFAMFFLYNHRKGSWGIIGAVLVVMIFDTLIVALFMGAFGTWHALTILFAIIGLIVVIFTYLTAKGEPEYVEKQYDKSKYYYPSVSGMESSEESREEIKKELKQEVKSELKAEQKHEASVEKTFRPGKFIASKNASKFHIAKCTWANNIKEENQVWFNSESEAKKAGYSEHKCDIVTGTTTAR